MNEPRLLRWLRRLPPTLAHQVLSHGCSMLLLQGRLLLLLLLLLLKVVRLLLLPAHACSYLRE